MLFGLICKYCHPHELNIVNYAIRYIKEYIYLYTGNLAAECTTKDDGYCKNHQSLYTKLTINVRSSITPYMIPTVPLCSVIENNDINQGQI